MAGPGSNIRCKAEAHVAEAFFFFFLLLSGKIENGDSYSLLASFLQLSGKTFLVVIPQHLAQVAATWRNLPLSERILEMKSLLVSDKNRLHIATRFELLSNKLFSSSLGPRQGVIEALPPPGDPGSPLDPLH